MVTICSMIQRHTPLRRASSHRDTMGGQASAAWQVRNRCLMPAGVFESGKPGIRRGESQLRPRQMTGQQPNGSRRPARKAISPGRSAPRLSWRVPGGWPPRAQVRVPRRSLAADRFEASRCLAPVAGGRQPRPRLHDRGHAVHPFTALPRTTCLRPGQRTEPADHMAPRIPWHFP
jgi:hypothetical protein